MIKGMLWLATQTLNILCLIHLWATHIGYVPKGNIIEIVAGINELRSSFCVVLFHCFSVY